MSTLVILGGGGHASDVLSVVESEGLARSRTVILDEGTIDPRRFENRSVDLCTSFAELATSIEVEKPWFVAGVGYPQSRRSFVARALDAAWRPIDALVHSSTQVMSGVQTGAGVVVMGLCWISPSVLIGDHAYVGYGAKLGHDSRIGNYSSLFPGCFIAGDVSIGDGVMVGGNATVLQGVSIGDEARIGAGAVVVSDVAPGEVVVGVPAAPR